jgi:TIR domain
MVSVADIFISYSKADRAEVELLSAFLEAQGYSVWWDSNLFGGDKYRGIIAAELTKACAVVVVWTKHSVGSDWAQRGWTRASGAKADSSVVSGDLAVFYATTRQRNTAANTVARVSPLVLFRPLLLISIILNIGIGSIGERQQAKLWKRMDDYVQRSFVRSPECVSFMQSFLRNKDNLKEWLPNRNSSLGARSEEDEARGRADE